MLFAFPLLYFKWLCSTHVHEDMPEEFKLANNLLIKQEDLPLPDSHNSMEIVQRIDDVVTAAGE